MSVAALPYDPAQPAVAREILSSLGAAPNQTLGQNFLTNGFVLDNIVKAAALPPQSSVLEIGPGLGALTVRLLAHHHRVVAIEKDRKFAAFLANLPQPNDFQVLHADALAVCWAELSLPQDGVNLVANLPYSISKPILRKIMEEWRPHLSSATVLLQREVANRLVARPATSDYGPLAIMANLWGEPTKCFDVAPGSFFPPPNVVSTLVHIRMRNAPQVALANEAAFWRVVRAAFGQRRKQLINTLQAIADKELLQSAFQTASIDGKRRGETLSLAEFARLCELIFP